MYQGQAGCISSYCVFQPKIPPSATDKIQTYLDGLNKENPSGRFYVDPTLSRLVYEVIYQLPEKADSWSLDLFCRYSYFPLKSQRQMLYWLITGKMVKKQNEEIITSR